MKFTRSVDMEQERVDVAVLLFQVSHGKFLNRLRGRLSRSGHEWQLKKLGDRETPRGITWQGPDNINDPVFDLFVELRWLSAQLHRRIDFYLNPSIRCCHNPVCPRLYQRGVGGGFF